MAGAHGKARNETNKLDADERVEEAKGADLDGRDGEEKGQPLRERKEEIRELAEDRIEQRAERRQKRYGRGPLPFWLELRGPACVPAPEPCGALAATQQATWQPSAPTSAKSGMGTLTRSLGIMCPI